MIKISNIETQTLSPAIYSLNSKGLNEKPKAINSRQQLRDLSDQELLARCRQGDAIASFSEIYRRYSALVLGVSLKYLKDHEEANDAVAEIFARLWDKLREYSPEILKAWLFTVTRNHCLQFIARDKHRNLSETLDQKKMLSLREEEDTESRNRELIAFSIEKAMQEIPEGQRKCLQLFFFDKASYMEISKKTGLEINKVKSNLQNGKRNLKLLLESKKINLLVSLGG